MIAKKDKLAFLNDWQSGALPEESPRFTIDQIVRQEELADVDFIKIDIDSNDLEALWSAEHTVKNSPVLGLALEVNFYGSPAGTDHTFHNTDRLMREWGFELFDLSIRRYSSSALPQSFEFDIPAQTVRGRPYQGDAIYLRDPCSWEYVSESAVSLDTIKLLKLACLFEFFSLPDHSAELLLQNEKELEQHVEVRPLLDLLAGEVDPSTNSYDEHLHRFTEDPACLFRSRVQENSGVIGKFAKLKRFLKG